KELAFLRTLIVKPRLFCPTFWGQYTHEATCMPRQHQDSLLDAARQGEEGHETAAKHSARVRINSVPHTVDIHLPHPEITL
ncbi:DUF5431 family protein, partial [Klebsiella quasipneumoniae]|uniref:DUF5431 family protein n=2 Tax=Gammaproteobacteria TaxID=1236 RepID=UPI0039B61F00